jgi:hypothetical protein
MAAVTREREIDGKAVGFTVDFGTLCEVESAAGAPIFDVLGEITMQRLGILVDAAMDDSAEGAAHAAIDALGVNPAAELMMEMYGDYLNARAAKKKPAARKKAA